MATNYDRLNILDEYHGLGIFSAKAGGTISGGDFVKWLSGTDVVNASGNGGPASYAGANDLVVSSAVSDLGSVVVGIAMNTVLSGTEVAVLTNGLVILPVGSTAIEGGNKVKLAGYSNSVIPIAAGSDNMEIHNIVGRALTKATAVTGYTIVKLSI